MPSSHLLLHYPLLLLPSVFPSISVFSNEAAFSIRWPKYWSFSVSISPYNEYSGLISFRMDWFGILAVQGTLMSLLQHDSSKASILQSSAMVNNLVALVVKNLPAKARDTGDLGSIPGSGRSPGGGNGNPLQYSCLENPTDREAWRATVRGVASTPVFLPGESH